MNARLWAFVAVFAVAGSGLLWSCWAAPKPDAKPLTIEDVFKAQGVELVGESAPTDPDNPFVSAQPPEEREKQNSLPKSDHPLWEVLNKSPISYSDEEPHITISLTEPVKALVGKEMTISGFVLPMDDGQHTGKTMRFLLSQRTPTCTWCPPGDPNEVVQVTVDSPMDWKGTELTVSGPFSLVNNTNNGIFYHISASSVVYK